MKIKIILDITNRRAKAFRRKKKPGSPLIFREIHLRNWIEIQIEHLPLQSELRFVMEILCWMKLLCLYFMLHQRRGNKFGDHVWSYFVWWMIIKMHNANFSLHYLYNKCLGSGKARRWNLVFFLIIWRLRVGDVQWILNLNLSVGCERLGERLWRALSNCYTIH